MSVSPWRPGSSDSGAVSPIGSPSGGWTSTPFGRWRQPTTGAEPPLQCVYTHQEPPVLPEQVEEQPPLDGQHTEHRQPEDEAAVIWAAERLASQPTALGPAPSLALPEDEAGHGGRDAVAREGIPTSGF